MSDPSKPVTVADDGFELCYECDGSRLCWSCRGTARRSNGDRCRTCAGDGLCIVCAGNGQLPVGTKAGVHGHVQQAVMNAEAGHELCYECDGTRLCWSCGGTGRRSNGDRCGQCVGRGLCIVCNGDGDLPLGTKADVFASSVSGAWTTTRAARMVGRYRELGFDNAPSLQPLVRTGSEVNREKAVAYLKAGKTLRCIRSGAHARKPFHPDRRHVRVVCRTCLLRGALWHPGASGARAAHGEAGLDDARSGRHEGPRD